MARWQWLGLVVGTVVVLGATLVVIDAAIRFYNTVALVSPLLAQLVLWVGIALALGVLGIALYYGWLFLRPRRRRRPPVAPRHPAQAASHNLETVQRQVEHIHDQVARQALLEKSQALQMAMDRGDLTIAVFGVGSAGKTSLINALLGEPRGAVGAPMGTTQTRQDYVWPLPQLPRRLVLIDTPGLSEVGVAGTLREQAAREIATEADLILFVIDDDLRQAEHGVLMPLLAMGKRTVLVLNKADRYLDPEVDMLLDRLRSRVIPPLSPDDVVAIAAAPQPLPKAGDGWLQMRPNLDPLLARLMDILRQEGDTLVADNILLQTQQLSDTARRLIDTQRQTQADAIIDRYQWIGAGAIAATPLPGFDFLATAAVNAQMVVELSRVYGYDVSLEEGKALAISLAKTLGGLGLVKGAVDLLALGLQTNVATVLAGRALKGVSGAYLTRVAGKSFVEYFRHNQDWGDGGMGAVVEEQFRLNQREAAMKAFVQDAIAKVVSNLPSEG
jgi:GTPase SAR1 family protein/membrane protein implicated in regulation of membrane protease activity